MKKQRLFFICAAAIMAMLTICVLILLLYPGQPLAVQPIPSTQSSQSGKLNINTANADQLSALPGIGDTLAARIVEYREENGPFQTIGQLINVPGIGQNKLTNIIDLITIGG